MVGKHLTGSGVFYRLIAFAGTVIKNALTFIMLYQIANIFLKLLTLFAGVYLKAMYLVKSL